MTKDGETTMQTQDIGKTDRTDDVLTVDQIAVGYGQSQVIPGLSFSAARNDSRVACLVSARSAELVMTMPVNGLDGLSHPARLRPGFQFQVAARPKGPPPARQIRGRSGRRRSPAGPRPADTPAPGVPDQVPVPHAGRAPPLPWQTGVEPE